MKVVDKTTEEDQQSVITVREKERFSNELTLVFAAGHVAHRRVGEHILAMTCPDQGVQVKVCGDSASAGSLTQRPGFASDFPRAAG